MSDARRPRDHDEQEPQAIRPRPAVPQVTPPPQDDAELMRLRRIQRETQEPPAQHPERETPPPPPVMAPQTPQMPPPPPTPPPHEVEVPTQAPALASDEEQPKDVNAALQATRTLLRDKQSRLYKELHLWAERMQGNRRGPLVDLLEALANEGA